MIWASLLLVTLAVARITRLVTTDRIMVRFRRWVVNRWGEESEAAYLAHCKACASIWVSAPMALGWALLVLPMGRWWLAIPAWLAISHAVILLARLESDE